MRNLFANHQPPLAAVRQGERAGIAVGTAQLFQGGSGTAQLSIRIRAFHCNEHPANPHKRQAVFAQHRQGGYRTGAGDIKLTAAAGFVLGFWRGIWGMALGLLLAVLYFCTAMLFQKFIHHPLPAMTRAALPLGPFLSIGFAALYCFGG